MLLKGLDFDILNDDGKDAKGIIHCNGAIIELSALEVEPFEGIPCHRGILRLTDKCARFLYTQLGKVYGTVEQTEPEPKPEAIDASDESDEEDSEDV